MNAKAAVPFKFGNTLFQTRVEAFLLSDSAKEGLRDPKEVSLESGRMQLVVIARQSTLQRYNTHLERVDEEIVRGDNVDEEIRGCLHHLEMQDA